MGRARPGLVMVVSVSLGSLWKQGLAMLLYGLSPLVTGHKRLAERVYYGPSYIDWWVFIGPWEVMSSLLGWQWGWWRRVWDLVDLVLRAHYDCRSVTKNLGLLDLVVAHGQSAVLVCYWGTVVWACLVGSLWEMGLLLVDGYGVGGGWG